MPWLKLQNKIGRLHEKVSNTRKDWHFKLAHNLCDLAENICQYCGHTEQRDIASAKVIRNRGLIAVGHTVSENACEVPLIGSDVLAGFEQLRLFELVKCH